MARRDSGAFAASRSMTASAVAAKSSGSATRAMRPRSYMRCAGIGSPRSSISLASTGPPTSISFLARNHDGASPICASDIPNVARGGGDHDVAVQREFVAAGDGRPLHDGHDRQGVRLDRVQRRFNGGLVAGGALVEALAEIDAGAEDGTGRPQRNHARLRRGRLGEGRLEPAQHLGVERVALLRAVERGGADGAVVGDREDAHAGPPFAPAASRSIRRRRGGGRRRGYRRAHRSSCGS